MLRLFTYLALAFAVITASACQSEAQQTQAQTTNDKVVVILVDQFGYLPHAKKVAVIKNPIQGYDAHVDYTPSQRFGVYDSVTNKLIFEGAPAPWNNGLTDPNSGDQVWWFDFSDVKAPGDYYIRDIENGAQSYAFRIADDVYVPVLKAAFRTFYLQRAGFEKQAKFTGKGYADGASHLQDKRARLYSAKDDISTERDLHGGWYDAGDYNQYTIWTAEYVAALLLAYDENPHAWGDDFGIPESGNGIPDILDEAIWGLNWLTRMQNDDGGMLSILDRDEASPPSAARGPSLYGPPTTAASYTAAGTFALADRIITRGNHRAANLDTVNYSRRAMKAWSWAEENPYRLFYNNTAANGSEGIGAGQQEVKSDRLAKKKLIAATRMAQLGQFQTFTPIVEALYNDVKPMKADTPNGFEGGMAWDMLAYQKHAKPKPSRKFSQRIQSEYANNILQAYNGLPAVMDKAHAYMAPIDGYWWGSNAAKSRRGQVFTQSMKLARSQQGRRLHADAALGYVNYLHGVNPNGKVYLTNMGALGAENSVDTLYHNWFADGSTKYDSVRNSTYGPPPGFLVGGPNPSYKRDSCCANQTCGDYGNKLCRAPILSPPAGQPPAKSYADFNDGWPINSWSVTENSNSYQVEYLRLLANFVP